MLQEENKDKKKMMKMKVDTEARKSNAINNEKIGEIKFPFNFSLICYLYKFNYSLLLENS